uniref:HEAT repeat domain-containing protein n=2 Tax=Ascaris lumbricoides TaxID=6252 RepID=A0A0M3HIF6_ASCLU
MSRAVKADLWTLYKLLCNDATPMVRRTAASKLGEFAKLVASDVSSDELISLFTFFATDDQVICHNCLRTIQFTDGISI